MSVQRGMIFNFMIPVSGLIVSTTVFGTLTLRTMVSKHRQVIVESIENILEKCQQMETQSANGEGVLGAELMSGYKCCDEMDKVCEFSVGL